MTLRVVHCDEVAPQPWKNGGGLTRELLAWPAAGTHGNDWALRISVADIRAGGPFSAYAGIERWFAVLEGAGVRLVLPDGKRCVEAGDAPLQFAGEAAPPCELLDGPTRDLNLMLRAGTRGVMKRAVSGEPWTQSWLWRAAFVSQPARLDCADGVAVELAADTLIAALPNGPCRLVAQTPAAPMFWIGVDAPLEA